jgi:hypothetical protein
MEENDFIFLKDTGNNTSCFERFSKQRVKWLKILEKIKSHKKSVI